LIPYFDENMGSRIPSALKTLGLKVIPGVKKRYGGGQDDIDYLKRAGQKRWLAISANKHMLDVKEERNTIISEKVGIVFVTEGQMHRPKLMLLLLKKWDWFEVIDKEEERPFAFYLYPSGKIRKRELS
jgi:hypothetical protein